MNIGVVGAGAIAEFLLSEINNKNTDDMTIKSIYVRDHAKYAHLEDSFNIALFDNLDAFLSSDIDIVIEAAGIQAVKELIPSILPHKNIVLISVGALADNDFFHTIQQLADAHHRTIYLPSGAIGGLDLLQNALAADGVRDVSLTTRKPAKSLIEDPSVTDETIVFEGKASEAIQKFPKNINVSIILSLAGLGIDQTNVTIIADPTVETNTHTINITGAFGSSSMTVSNQPLEENPKTSYLAAMSILGTLKRLHNPLKLG